MQIAPDNTGCPPLKPLLKWAGGKTQLLDELLRRFPVAFEKYIEPFFGGGAVFFAICPKRSVVADINPELINFYQQVADAPGEVISQLATYRNTAECFYATRAMNWRDMTPVEAAARTLFLNKTCFNGLYRVNRKGQFNTPFGRYKNPRIVDEKAILAASSILRQAHIVCDDYSSVLARFAEPGDLVFLDPPYVPVSPSADFKRYNKEQFREADHIKLAATVEQLHDMGCFVLLTNSNHPTVHRLYAQFPIHIVPTKRHISCRGDGRTGEDAIVAIPPRKRQKARSPSLSSAGLYEIWAGEHSLSVHEARQLYFANFEPEPVNRVIAQLNLSENHRMPSQAACFPTTRFMGSKSKLLPAIWEIVRHLKFDTAIDLFSGSGIVGYLFKSAGKRVVSNDHMYMATLFAKAMIENNRATLPLEEAERLLIKREPTDGFVEDTFAGLYFCDEDNRLIDVLRANIKGIDDPCLHAIAMAGLVRACMKKRARGIFTYVGQRYDDGRKDLRKTLANHFLDAVETINRAVFDNGRDNQAITGDAMDVPQYPQSLVYIDPPYYSACSDNEYVRRYHFVEGLVRDWQDVEIQWHTKTRKFKAYPTPFSSRLGARQAFEQLFQHFCDQILVVSYSSNCLPTMDELLQMMSHYKRDVRVFPIDYTYSFGNQGHKVGNNRNFVQEYIFVGV